MKAKRHIAIVTSTRADWGLLSPVAHALESRDDTVLTILATNMHLDPRRGNTIEEIEREGFADIRPVGSLPQSDSDVDTARAMGSTLADMAEALGRLRPDIVVILGDRYEMLAVASAATLLGIPIAHISGGEITEGAFDDNIRHAISKLSSLHFASTEPYRQRLIAMGEDPDKVHCVGALGVENIHRLSPLSQEALEASLGFKIEPPTAIVTFHPATSDPVDPAERFEALLSALDSDSHHLRLIFTYPNNDPRSARIIEMIDSYVAAHPDTSVAVPSLGRERYLSALRYVDLVIGNSSSGIVEVPSAGIPTIDIGIRQRGRTFAPSVIHCGDNAAEISRAIDQALSPEYRLLAAAAANPYDKPGTASFIAETVATADLSSLLPKHFHDINPLT